MRNVTISLDEELARWARVTAAERDLSVSRFVGNVLRELMESEKTYERAMKSNLSLPPVALKRGGSYPTREEIHDRKGLRRQ